MRLKGFIPVGSCVVFLNAFSCWPCTGVQVVLLFLLMGPWIWSQMMRTNCSRLAARAWQRSVQRKVRVAVASS